MCISVSLVAVDGKGEEFFCFLASRVFLYARWDHVWVVVITHLYLSAHQLCIGGCMHCKNRAVILTHIGLPQFHPKIRECIVKCRSIR